MKFGKIYQISNLGRVKSLSKKLGFLILKERIMKKAQKAMQEAGIWNDIMSKPSKFD